MRKSLLKGVSTTCDLGFLTEYSELIQINLVFFCILIEIKMLISNLLLSSNYPIRHYMPFSLELFKSGLNYNSTFL